MKIALHLISDSDKHFAGACDEYTKRLGNAVTIHTHKPVKHGTTQQIIEQETLLLLSKLNTRHPCIVLNPQGENRTTKQRHKKLYGKNIQIVIGGPYGLDYSQFGFATHVSLGNHTMPHGLAKLVMLEQCYRLRTLGMNKKYHY